METRRDAFHAISDPTRRQIIGMIAHRNLNLNTIAENFDMSRQAISLHIKILRECGLITIRQEGRERFCEAKLQNLREVSSWVDEYKQFWTRNFESLEKYLKKIQPIKKDGNKKSKKQRGHSRH
ncbi:MAG: metalloregulator ArsR/SmtB family transcription factor [Bacteroidota bacterium]